jgi:hypothetical protein
LRISFGIQGGKRFSTATFRAGTLFYPYPGLNPGLSPVVPSGQNPYSRDRNRFENLSAKSKPPQPLQLLSRTRTTTRTRTIKRNRKGEHTFAFLAGGPWPEKGSRGRDPSYKRGLKVELVDVSLGENSRRAEQDLATVNHLEFAEFAAFNFGIARLEFSVNHCAHHVG